MFTSPSQILLSIGNFHIYYYGVVMALAIIVGVIISDYLFSQKYNKKEVIYDLAPYVIITGIIGARLYYCILNYSFYLRFPTEILAIRHGGISIHGAILGGIIGILLYAKRRNLPFFRLTDFSVVGLSIGQAIGRWGNFFNSEAFGLPTNLPWGLYIQPQYRPIPYTNYEYFHPAFLYESILDFVIFVILLFIIKKGWNKIEGLNTFIYLILYSMVRILVESVRIDSAAYIYGVPIAIIVSVCIIVVSLAGICMLKVHNTDKA